MILETIQKGQLPNGVMKRLIKVGEKENLNYRHLIIVFNVAYKIFVKTL
jgi:hypothetical protein